MNFQKVKVKSKLIIFLSVFLLLIGVYIFTFWMPKDYEVEYFIGDIQVKESYNKKENILKLYFNDFSYEVNYKYTNHRKIIKNVEINQNCLKASSDYLSVPSICKNDEDYTIKLEKKEVSLIDNFENVDIYSLDYNYMFWNYDHFVYLSKNNNKIINLFDKEMYQIDLISQVNNYLISADYNETYSFDKFYVVNLKNAKVSNINLQDKINFNSYILGSVDDKVYLYDVSDKKEYMINPSNGKVNETNLSIYKNGKFEEITSKKLDKKDQYFELDNNFYILDNNLYYKSGSINYILINDVSKIIRNDINTVIYLKDDTLYYLNIFDGYQKLVRYSEWKFNSKNIYVE